MEVGLIFKIAAVGILVTILSQVLKHSGRDARRQRRSRYGPPSLLPYIFDLFSTIQTLFSL